MNARVYNDPRILIRQEIEPFTIPGEIDLVIKTDEINEVELEKLRSALYELAPDRWHHILYYTIPVPDLEDEFLDALFMARLDQEDKVLLEEQTGIISKVCKIFHDLIRMENDETMICIDSIRDEWKLRENKEACRMIRAVFGLNSTTDLITNSSSELFVCSKGDSDANTISNLILERIESFGEGLDYEVTAINMENQLAVALFNESWQDIYVARGGGFVTKSLEWVMKNVPGELIQELVTAFNMVHHLPAKSRAILVQMDNNNINTMDWMREALHADFIDAC